LDSGISSGSEYAVEVLGLGHTKGRFGHIRAQHLGRHVVLALRLLGPKVAGFSLGGMDAPPFSQQRKLSIKIYGKKPRGNDIYRYLLRSVKLLVTYSFMSK
jgi:hypothetical protein